MYTFFVQYALVSMCLRKLTIFCNINIVIKIIVFLKVIRCHLNTFLQSDVKYDLPIVLMHALLI